MKTSISIMAAIFCSAFLAFGCSDSDPSGPSDPFEELDPVAISKTNPTKIYMHYMPWFETKASSPNGQWGYHWTMSNRNPDIITNGKREIASHYYPMIGPYHSGDKQVIENHLLMMKYAGIDGILIDWYGTYDLNDFRLIKQNTEQLIDMLDEVGLEYAIVYEDRFLPDIVNAGLAPSVTSAARTDFSYLQNNCFNDANYIKIDGKPLLLNFGPIVIQTESGWTDAFENLNPKPTFLTLWNESADAGTNASGEFAWVYQNSNALTSFYNNNLPNLNVAFGSAYPGFDDYYEEGGAGNIIGWSIAHNNGATLDDTLQLASNAGVDYLQLITWNDFGEGTMIEPTVEFGYSYVNKIRTFAGVQNTPAVFSDISRLYDLRLEHAQNTAIQRKLDQAFYYFVSLQTDKAIAKLNEIQ
ncbi:glycoside hydrolase family 99-like domain-containing protein [Flavobacterium sp. MAH-1]|uniref:Glycoside hydrolase family 99-like domain-containing protein n=1 Tax=Flavobacterium agri TaxID=2743471 RepID=A0A7Y8Y280_9FLAO|nr:glycoside hydrolase family 71/99-like protein [Flavobacterium agri]NUY81038.1 glycoside hydrolase family 99-like domain-containing protein [Flavobacterium agri]NYA71062.1 glycoside hydrolase family 99-like domain-containing protein [Flavobacterium agri]